MTELTPAEQRDQYQKVCKIYGATYGEGDVKGLLSRVTDLEKADSKRAGVNMAIAFFISTVISVFKS